MLEKIRLAAWSTLIVAASPALAEDFDPASYLDTTCSRCHGSEVYTREDRRVQSYAGLEAQVARCDANLGTKLFPEELEILTHHLNETYYKFAR